MFIKLLCHCWIQSIYFSHREVFSWGDTFNIDLIGIIRYTIHDDIGKSTFTITDLLVPTIHFHGTENKRLLKIFYVFYVSVQSSASVSLRSSHSSRISTIGFVYFFRTVEKVPLSLAACKSNNRSGSRTYRTE